jgi:hypothetical protein
LRCANIIGLLLATAAMQAAPSVQVRILLERVDHSLVVVSPRHEFHSGDRIHLRVTLSEASDVYVLSKTEADFSIDPVALRAGTPHLVLGRVHLKAGESDLDTITFDQTPGIETLAIVAASRPDDQPTVIEMSLRHAN